MNPPTTALALTAHYTSASRINFMLPVTPSFPKIRPWDPLPRPPHPVEPPALWMKKPWPLPQPLWPVMSMPSGEPAVRAEIGAVTGSLIALRHTRAQ